MTDINADTRNLENAPAWLREVFKSAVDDLEHTSEDLQPNWYRTAGREAVESIRQE